MEAALPGAGAAARGTPAVGSACATGPGAGPLTDADGVTEEETRTEGAGAVLADTSIVGALGAGGDEEGVLTDKAEGAGVASEVLGCDSETAGSVEPSDGSFGGAEIVGTCDEIPPTSVPCAGADGPKAKVPSSAVSNGSPSFALPGDVIPNPWFDVIPNPQFLVSVLQHMSCTRLAQLHAPGRRAARLAVGTRARHAAVKESGRACAARGEARGAEGQMG